MSSISTHVLDTARGMPAAGIDVVLEIQAGEVWRQIGRSTTDGDGRVRAFVQPGEELTAGSYRLRFATAIYQTGFYPEVVITFAVTDPAQHYHVPLLLSPFGYSTYRGS